MKDGNGSKGTTTPVFEGALLGAREYCCPCRRSVRSEIVRWGVPRYCDIKLAHHTRTLSSLPYRRGEAMGIQKYPAPHTARSARSITRRDSCHVWAFAFPFAAPVPWPAPLWRGLSGTSGGPALRATARSWHTRRPGPHSEEAGATTAATAYVLPTPGGAAKVQMRTCSSPRMGLFDGFKDAFSNHMTMEDRHVV